MPVYSLRQKAHASKESYYLNLLKEADEEETEHWNKTRQTALFAFTVLVLSGVDFYAPLSPEGNGVLAQIADGLGQNGYGWLVCLGCILVVLAFYPIFEDRHPMVHCPELARELEKKRQEELEKQERSRREVEEIQERFRREAASRPRPLSEDDRPWHQMSGDD